MALRLNVHFLVADLSPRVFFLTDTNTKDSGILYRHLSTRPASMVGVRGLGWFSFESPVVFKGKDYEMCCFVDDNPYFGRKILEQAQAIHRIKKYLPSELATNPDSWTGETLKNVAMFLTSPYHQETGPKESPERES